MIALALFLLAQAPTTPTNAAPTKVLVLELTGEVSPTTLRLLSDAVAAELATQPDLQVLSSEDVRRALDVEAERQLLSCNASSCMAEIASALGASTTVYGSAGKVGTHTVVTLNAFDAQKGQSVGKEVVDVDNDGALLPGVRAAALRVMGRAPTTSTTAPPSSLSPLLLAGAVTAGTGVIGVVVGGVVYATADVDGAVSFEDKTQQKTTQDIGAIVIVASAGLVVVGAAVAVIGLVVE